jgi:DNA-binding GntR family transcriptional regulator
VLAQERARRVARVVDGWSSRRGPLASALAEALAEAIEFGRVSEHLPSERAFAAELHLSRATVASAYDILRERGIIDRQRGSGTVTATPPAHRVCADPLACVRSFFEHGGRTL